MRPEDVIFNRSDIVRVKNIDNEDFNYRFEGKDYLVKKDETLLMPGSMANHFVYHFVNYLMIKENKILQMREVISRKPYIDKIFLGIEKSAALIEKVETQEEKTEREFNEMNEPEEDLTAEPMTEEEAEKVMPKDEELYPDPKKIAKEEDEEKTEPEFPGLRKEESDGDGGISEEVPVKSRKRNKRKGKRRTKS
jgi:hypothetical protein